MVDKFSVPSADDRWGSGQTCGWFFGKLFEVNGVRKDRSIKQDDVFANDGSDGVVLVFGTVGPREISHVLYA